MPVTLDMTTAQALQPSPVILDMTTAQPLQAKQPDVIERIGNRLQQNTNLPNILDTISKAADEVTKPGTWDFQHNNLPRNMTKLFDHIKQTYSDPANILADLGTGWLTGEIGGVPESEGASPAVNAVRTSAPSASNVSLESILAHPGVQPWVDALKSEIMKAPGAHIVRTILKSGKGFAEGAPKDAALDASAAIPSHPAGPPELWGKMIPTSDSTAAASATPFPTTPAMRADPLPPSERFLAGDSALRQILGGQDNVNLMRIAKARGINTARESVLKPGKADPLLINKIIDDFSPTELDDIADMYDVVRRNKHQWGDIGPDAQKTLSMQTYFPDVKVPQTVLKRVINSLSRNSQPAAASQSGEEDLVDVLQKSLDQATKRKASGGQ